MKTANLAIVFTDIKGFTERTSRQTLEQNQRLLQVHSSLLTPLFRAFGGRIVKSIGDAFLVTFESPTQAVLSGVAIQDRLWEHNRTAPESERLEVRVAVNVGEVRVEGGDIFGEPVNIAARVESIAEVGEIYFTEAVYLSMNKADVPSEEVGLFELKGIPGKIKIFRVPKAPYRVEAPVVAATAGPSEHIPPYGNLGLSRVGSPDLASRASSTAAVLGEKAAQLGSRAAELMERTSAAIGQSDAGRKAALKKPGVLVGAGIGAILLIGLLVFALRSPIEGALEEVRASTGEEREAKVEAARKLIAAEPEADRAYFHGRLAEAEGEPDEAPRYYRAAIKAGSGRAESRLEELLSHANCSARVSAARVAGELKLTGLKGELETLAEEGGPGDDDTPLFGCNSKKAAQEALRRLK